MSRNDFLDSLQGNRNPFVDNPDWVCYIDFKTMTYIANPTIPCAINTSGVDKYNTGISFKVFPNPTTEQSTITLWSEEDGDGNLELVDMTGKVIWAQNLNVAEGNNTYTMAPELGAGIYMIRVTTPDGVGIQRWVKQ